MSEISERFRNVAERQLDSQTGRYTVEQAVATFGIGDVLVHTWDLARAVGLDDALDADEVHRLDVTDDADEQTRLLAFTGRRP